MQNHLIFLERAKQKIKIADHMVYVTYPLVKDKKILLTIISGIHDGIMNIIKASLYHESSKRNIHLLKNENENLRIFFRNIAPRYNITEEEIRIIKEIIAIELKHKQSPMEFLKKDKLVILSESMQVEIVTIEHPKKFLNLAKNLLNKIEEKINS